MTKRKDQKAKPKRQAKPKTVRERFLRRAKAKPGARTMNDRATNPTAAEIRKDAELIALFRESMKRSQALRDELAGEGDNEYGELLEMVKATGLDVATLTSMSCTEYDKWLRAAIRKRKQNESDPWVVVVVGDCALHRNTVNRHADDPAKTYIEHTDERGKYRIRKSRLVEYIDRAEIGKYLP